VIGVYKEKKGLQRDKGNQEEESKRIVSNDKARAGE